MKTVWFVTGAATGVALTALLLAASVAALIITIRPLAPSLSGD